VKRIFPAAFAVSVAFALGAIVGWFGRAAQAHAESDKPCRDEVISVDGAHGPVSCTHDEMLSELKDGYLICKCRKH
jgi:hypothetical protein